LKALTEALREIDDADYEWRAFLERTLVEAYADNKQMDEANALARELLKFIRNYLPNTFEDFFEFLVRFFFCFIYAMICKTHFFLFCRLIIIC
jgi:hypothetical protein